MEVYNLRLAPGDVLVIHMSEMLSKLAYDRLREEFALRVEAAVGFKVPVVITAPEIMALGVMTVERPGKTRRELDAEWVPQIPNPS
jgi:hypothetical protein